jgi:TatD DNase family protein
MLIIDTHAHLNFKAFDKDRDQIIKKCLQENIWMINVGTNFFSSKIAVEIAQNYEFGVYATIGLHPINIKTNSKVKSQTLPARPAGGPAGRQESKLQVKIQNFNKEDILEEDFDYQKYNRLAQNKKVVAIGEIGLDYYYKPKTKQRLEEFKNKQREIFLKQLELAQELNLPIIFHCRMAHQELIELLKQKTINPPPPNLPAGRAGLRRAGNKQKIKGVIHCFTGNWEQAKEYLEMGLYLGFNGIIFKLDLDKVIQKIPLDKILIETDCPFLAPPGYKERNDPMSLPIIAQKIAEIKKTTSERILEKTKENAKRLFLDNQ